MTEWYRENKCTWKVFLEEVKQMEGRAKKEGGDIKSFLYRGQSDNMSDNMGKKPELMSSFDRAVDVSKPIDHKRWEYEAAILREFMRRAHQYVIINVPEKYDLMEWLALMRHYGAPTRLVDFTYSHYIAAYFAFSSLKKEPRAVWAISQEWLKEVTDTIIFNEDLHHPKLFIKHFFKRRSPQSFVAAVNTERMNTRLTIQQGVFLCPANIEKTFEENLKSNLRIKARKPNSIVKFVIKHEERNHALTELKHMNISNATLFPDLDGFAKSLNDRFELLFKDYHIPEETLKEVVKWPRKRTGAA